MTDPRNFFKCRNASRAERQDAVVIQTGKTVDHSVPVLDAANKPTTADRKSEASLPSADSCQSAPPSSSKSGKSEPDQRLAWAREMVRRAREGWPVDGQRFLPLSRP
jgi:hypothetical protein